MQVVPDVAQAIKSPVTGAVANPLIVLDVVAPLDHVVVAVLLYSASEPAVPDAPIVSVGLDQVRLALPACV